MLKFKYNKDKNSKMFVFTRINKQSSSNNYDDFSKIDDFFKPEKEKESFFRKIKKKIDNSKIGGLIYIVLFFLILFMGYSTFRFFYYSSSITSDEYNIVKITRAQSDPTYSPYDPEYIRITIKFEVDGEIISSDLFYYGGNRDKIYKDWISYSTSYNSNIDIEIKNKLGTLYYNKKNPEKVVDNRFF